MVRDSKGRFTKAPVKVWVDYDKESHLEHLIEGISVKSRVWSVEEIEEAIKGLNITSPIERAVQETEKLTEIRMRHYFNGWYVVWLTSSVAAVVLSYYLGYIT